MEESTVHVLAVYKFLPRGAILLPSIKNFLEAWVIFKTVEKMKAKKVYSQPL
jgi:hypothetical protein